MPVRTDEAFVLTRYPFRERDWVVVLLTREAGLVKLVARRVRGARSGRGAALEPLASLRVSYFEKSGAELATLDEAELTRSAFALAADPVRWASGQVVAELALTFCPPGQASEPAFRLLGHCVDALLAGHDAAAVWHYAELWFLRLAGVFPELDRCGVCGEGLPAGTRIFDEGERTFVCAQHRPLRPTILAEAAVRWLHTASRQPLAGVAMAAPRDAVAWLVGLRRHFTDRALRSEVYLRSLLAE
jgi:DNA repair protein RecO (recombination protein O)